MRKKIVGLFPPLLVTILAIFSHFSLAQTSTEAENKLTIKNIFEMEIESSINPATLNYLDNGFKEAHTLPYDLILIKLSTPGGLVTTTKSILTLIGRSQIPIAIWITPEGASATSAGAIISSSAHLLFMSEGTNIGAATPVELGKDIESKDLRKKAINDLVSLVDGLATARHRNSSLFIEMVDKGASFSAVKAKESNLIDGIASTYKELTDQLKNKQIHLQGKKITLDSADPKVTKFNMDFGQKLLDILANPQLAYICFILGMALLYFEMQAPGGFIAGSVGAILLVFAAISFQVLPLNWGAMGLILLSFVFFTLEVWITSYGLLSLAGLSSLIAGSLFLFRTDETFISMGIGVIVSVALAIGTFLGLMSLFILKDFKKNKQKRTKIYDLQDSKAIVVEDTGRMTDGKYHYTLKLHGEIWKGITTSPVKIGDEVTIKSQRKDDLMLEF